MLSILPYIFYDLGKKLNRRLSRIQHKWFLLIVVSIIGLSAKAAVYYNRLDNSVAQDMATGAFSGGIISFIILLYEQFREEERHNIQSERDKDQASRLRHDANRSEDIRSAANLVLFDIKPIYYSTFGYGDVVRLSMVSRYEFWNKLEIGANLVNRINDETLNKVWTHFWEESILLLNSTSQIVEKQFGENVPTDKPFIAIDSLETKPVKDALDVLQITIEAIMEKD